MGGGKVRVRIDGVRVIRFNYAEVRRIDGDHQVQLFYNKSDIKQWRYTQMAKANPDIFDTILNVIGTDNAAKGWELIKNSNVWVYKLKNPQEIATFNIKGDKDVRSI